MLQFYLCSFRICGDEYKLISVKDKDTRYSELTVSSFSYGKLEEEVERGKKILLHVFSALYSLKRLFCVVFSLLPKSELKPTRKR